jgi:hypothetical protein
LNDRLSSFLIEIECPSGAKLVGDLKKVALMVSSYMAPVALGQENTAKAAAIYNQIENVESNIFAYIWTIPFEELLGVMRATNVGTDGLAGDQQAWAETISRLRLDTLEGPNPFLIRIIPKVGVILAEPVGDGTSFTADEVGDMVETLLRIANLADSMGAGLGHDVVDHNRRKIMSLSEDLKKAIYVKATTRKLPAASPFPDPQGRIIPIACPDEKHTDTHPAGDGWGHAHTADTVEALLREGSAMLEGTDKHEQMFADMDEKVKTQFLFKIIESLQKDRATQAHRSDIQSKRIEALETLVRDLGKGHQQLVQSTQKLHRRLSIPVGHYTTESDVLRSKADEIQKLIAFAKQVEASPVLRQFLA